MKTKIKLFMSAIIMLLFVGVFSGCSSDDEFLLTSDFGELSAEDNENIEAITQFLRKTFPYGYRDTADDFKKIEHYKGFRTDIAAFDTCFILNSYEDLEAIYTGDEEIPKIDFLKFSVILGEIKLPYRGFKYESYSVKNSENETLVTFNFKDAYDPNILYYALEIGYFFQRVVPKFEPKKKIRMETNII